MGKIEEQNKEIVYKTVEASNDFNHDYIVEISHPDMVFHVSPEQDLQVGRGKGWREAAGELRNAFPDIHYTIENIIAEGDMVATRYRGRTTHTGSDWMGLPATGKQTITEGIIISRFKDGKEIERWEGTDRLRLYVQRGLIPPLEEIQRFQKQKQIEEENKEVVRQAFGLLSQRKVDECFEYFAPEYIEHTTDADMSWETTKQAVIEFQKAFTASNVTFDLVVGEDDMVAVRETLTGTHTGEFMGISPTGKEIKICNNFIVKIAGGKIIEGWSTFDSMSLMQQIGAIPS